jgi:WD40 repeat protein
MALTVSPDGRLLVSGGRDKAIRVWDLPGYRPLGVLSGHTSEVHAVAVGPGGRLVSGSHDRTLRVWELTVSGDPSADRP